MSNPSAAQSSAHLVSRIQSQVQPDSSDPSTEIHDIVLPSLQPAPCSISSPCAFSSASAPRSQSSSPSSSHSVGMSPTTALRATVQPARVLRLVCPDDAGGSDGTTEVEGADSTSLAAFLSPASLDSTMSASEPLDECSFITASTSIASTSRSASDSFYTSELLPPTSNKLNTSFESISLSSPPTSALASRLLSESPPTLDRRSLDSENIHTSVSPVRTLTSPSRISTHSSPPTQSVDPGERAATLSNLLVHTLAAPTAEGDSSVNVLPSHDPGNALQPIPHTVAPKNQPPTQVDEHPPSDSAASSISTITSCQPRLSNIQQTPNVYINGLPPYFPEDQLYALAKPYGEVKSVRSFTRRVGERCSGYGFVLFGAIDEAERCIESLRRYRNLHPSFSKQIHKIPGTTYAISLDQSSSISSSEYGSHIQDGDDEESRNELSEADLSFKARMDRLADRTSTNLYFEGLPLSTDEATLAALVSPHIIKSSRFFQTKLSHPPRIIAFVRLETREAAEEIIERLHGRMVRGWNDPGSRISVRFADNTEQRELRRNERIAREGEPSPARLTIAQAALLNLHGKELQTQPQSSPLPPPSRSSQYPHSVDNAFVTARPASSPYQHLLEPEPDIDMNFKFNSRRPGTSPGVLPRIGEQRMLGDLGIADMVYSGDASLFPHSHAHNGGFTPAEELILQAHAQGRLRSQVDGEFGRSMGAGIPYVSPHQQQVLTIQKQQALLAQRTASLPMVDSALLPQSTLRRQLDYAQLPFLGSRHPQQIQLELSPRNNQDLNPTPFGSDNHPVFDQPQRQQYNVATSHPAQFKHHKQPRSSANSHRPTSLLSYQQRHYQQTQHISNINNNSNSNANTHVQNISKRANHYADKIVVETRNFSSNSNNANDGPFFEHNQNHHHDVMRHNSDVHNYSSNKGHYENARFVAQPFRTNNPTSNELHGVALDHDSIMNATAGSPSQPSPSLTYNSSRTPSTLSPATPFFGSFAPSVGMFETTAGLGKKVKA